MKESTRATTSGWTTVQKVLHWVIAAAVIYQLSLGFGLDDFADEDPERIEVLRLHATMGITIFALMLVRVGWRLTHAAPSPPSNLSPMLARAARATHLGLYAALLVLPLSGLLHVVITHDHVPLLGADLPGLGAHGKVGAALWYVHAAFAIAISVMVIGHVGAAIRHAFLRDGTLSRMLPWR